jgi:hypothetical protein
LMANVLLSSSVVLHYVFEILIFFVPEWAMRMIVVSYDVGNHLPSQSRSGDYYYSVSHLLGGFLLIFAIVIFALGIVAAYVIM